MRARGTLRDAVRRSPASARALVRELERGLERAQERALDEERFTETRSLVLRARVPYAALLHLSGRTLLAVYGVARVPRGRARKLAATGLAASVAFDVVELYKMRESERSGAVTRLARDVSESAFYSAQLADYSAASITGAALATELSFRYGPNAAVSLLPHVLATLLARRASGQKADLDRLYYLFVGCAGGLAIRRMELRRLGEHEQRRTSELQAAKGSVETAGRRRVALYQLRCPDAREETAHEVIANARLVLDITDVDEGSPLGQIIDNRRERLWGGPAIFLGDALDRWTIESRRRILRVADQVWEIARTPETARVLLSDEQEAALHEALDEFRPKGRLEVRARTGLSSAIRLDVSTDDAKTRIDLPGPSETRPFSSTDPIAAAVALGSLWAAGQATRAGEEVPLRAAAPGIAAYAVAALFADSRIDRAGIAAHMTVYQAALTAGVVQLVTSHLGTLHAGPRETGHARIHVHNALLSPAIVAGFSWKSLSPRQRTEVVLEGVAVLAIGTYALDRPVPWRHLLLNLLAGPVAGGIGASIYRLHVEQDTLRESDEYKAELADAKRRAANEAERDEWRLVRDAALEALARVRPDLDPDVRDRYVRALKYVAELSPPQIDLTYNAAPRPQPARRSLLGQRRPTDTVPF